MWMQFSARYCRCGLQKYLGIIWVILNFKDVEMSSFFYENYKTKIFLIEISISLRFKITTKNLWNMQP